MSLKSFVFSFPNVTELQSRQGAAKAEQRLHGEQRAERGRAAQVWVLVEVSQRSGIIGRKGKMIIYVAHKHSGDVVFC